MGQFGELVFDLAWLAGLVLLALIAHRIGMAVARRLSSRSNTGIDDTVIRRVNEPLRWIFVAFAVAAVLPRFELEGAAGTTAERGIALIVPLLVGWLLASLLAAFKDMVPLRFDIRHSDNLRARQAHTRIMILYRIGLAIIAVVTICMMLMTLPGVRAIGVTLFASAGLAGLAVGAAAQPALKNLIAGIQLAFSEPIRIDDVVVIGGEWGRIEEIRLSYVVVKIWDERRLIVPVSKFLEEPFQNWTRVGSEVLGTAMFHVDYTVDVAAARAKLEEIVRRSSLWDGRVVGLQVTELKERAMELRALVSAADSGRSWDLRCEVREKLMAWLVEAYPGCLPRERVAAELEYQEAPAAADAVRAHE